MQSQTEKHSASATLVSRRTTSKLETDSLPRWTRAFVSGDTLTSSCSSLWNKLHFDEAHAMVFKARPTSVKLEEKLVVTGSQWLVPTVGGCRLHTRVKVECRIPFAARAIERFVAEKVARGWEQFPDDLKAFLSEHPGALKMPVRPVDAAPLELATEGSARSTYDVNAFGESCGADLIVEVVPCACLLLARRWWEQRRKRRRGERLCSDDLESAAGP